MNRPGSFNTDADFARACKAVPMERIATTLTLHPDTTPTAIAAAQRDAIREVSGWQYLTDGELSAAVCLPVSVVVRRMAEIRKAMRRKVAV
jgi:hypothetical protein